MIMQEPLPWHMLWGMCGVMLVAWLWQKQRQCVGIVDVVWSILIAASGVIYSVTGTAHTPTLIFIGLLTTLWYGRLGWHLWQRLQQEGEDGRYDYLKRYWGDNAQPYLVLMFLGQALLAWLFSLPAWLLSTQPDVSPYSTVYVLLATVLAIGSWWGQHTADQQLARFRHEQRNNDRKQVCQVGLWRYSRHPNYFFEWLQWWCWPLLGLQYGWEVALWLALAPLAMLLFLYFITGIPYTEQQALRTRGDLYRAYQQQTSAFIPWFPKKSPTPHSIRGAQ